MRNNIIISRDRRCQYKLVLTVWKRKQTSTLDDYPTWSDAGGHRDTISHRCNLNVRTRINPGSAQKKVASTNENKW